MRFLRAEEIKELLAWTAQERCKPCRKAQRREIPQAALHGRFSCGMTTIPIIASMAHSRFPRGFLS